MVFKGRFFPFRKSNISGPDGSSNSPQSPGSNSPITPSSGNSQFKDSSSKKDSKGKGIFLKTSAQSRDLVKTSAAVTSSLKGVEITGAKEGKDVGSAAAAVSLSPIVASPLGLKKIRTRSGPLPRESFCGCGSSKDKVFGNVESDGWVDSGSNSDSTSTDSEPSRDQSPQVQGGSRLQNGESSSSEAGRFNTSWGHSGGPQSSDMYNPEEKTSYECENPEESESPCLQAILRVTSAPRKRFPGDIKSFSHELNSKGVIPFPFWKPRGLDKLEEVLVMIRARFDKAKEEVDSDLHFFAADLVRILEKDAESHPEWQETIEDLLVLARTCAMTPPGEFWLQCEGIVQELDDRRQELPMGMLKQLHTRMHFILTRCTRLLQFHKESGFAEDEHAFQLHPSLQPADNRVPPPADNRVPPSMPMDGIFNH